LLRTAFAVFFCLHPRNFAISWPDCDAINSRKFELAARLRDDPVTLRDELKVIREPTRELQFHHFETVLK